MRLLLLVVWVALRLPTSILKRGSKDGMQALIKPMLSSRQLQMTDAASFPAGEEKKGGFLRQSRAVIGPKSIGDNSQVMSSLGRWTT